MNKDVLKMSVLSLLSLVLTTVAVLLGVVSGDAEWFFVSIVTTLLTGFFSLSAVELYKAVETD